MGQEVGDAAALAGGNWPRRHDVGDPYAVQRMSQLELCLLVSAAVMRNQPRSTNHSPPTPVPTSTSTMPTAIKT